MKTYVNELKEFATPELKAFNAKLIPSTKYEILGVATPSIRSLAKEIGMDVEFLNTLPHKYHEENMLHAFLITYAKVDIDKRIKLIEEFLSFVDNWAVCDSLLRPTNPFTKYKEFLLEFAYKLVKHQETYHIRFGIGLFLSFGLKNKDITKYLDCLLQIKNHDYYVEMMLAWFYATALINHESEVLKLLTEKQLSTFVHNKTIQKAIESYRISSELKQQLKQLKR